MALKYKNSRTGRVVTVLEPVEIEEKAELEAEHLARGGTARARVQAERVAARAVKEALHARRTISKMDASETWDRIRDEPKPQPKPEPEEPKASDVRAWAKAEGLDVPDRGKLPDEVVEQYKSASGE